MFSDNKKPKPATELGRQPNRIGKNTIIKGDITSEADFRIDGKLEGNVRTFGKVVIGKDGYINGKVECVSADIEGKLNGELQVSNLLLLKASVSVSKLAVELGATFNASCIMSKAAPASLGSGGPAHRLQLTKANEQAKVS